VRGFAQCGEAIFSLLSCSNPLFSPFQCCWVLDMECLAIPTPTLEGLIGGFRPILLAFLGVGNEACPSTDQPTGMACLKLEVPCPH
jgi:hypothetical protein